MAASTEQALGINNHEERKNPLCHTMFLVAIALGFLAVLAAACNIFLLPDTTITDWDALTHTILDWMNTLSGTATII